MKVTKSQNPYYSRIMTSFLLRIFS